MLPIHADHETGIIRRKIVAMIEALDRHSPPDGDILLGLDIELQQLVKIDEVNSLMVTKHRKTLSWYDDRIDEIWQEIGNTSTSVDNIQVGSEDIWYVSRQICLYV